MKPAQCQDIHLTNALVNTGLKIEQSWSCPTCQRLTGSFRYKIKNNEMKILCAFRVPEYFNHEDWIDVTFNAPIKKFRSVLFPIEKATSLDNGQRQRFQFGY